MPFELITSTAAAAVISASPITVPIDKVELVENYKEATRKEYVCNVKPRFIRYDNFERVEYIRQCSNEIFTYRIRDPKFKIFFTINGKQVSMVVSEVPGRTITLQ